MKIYAGIAVGMMLTTGGMAQTMRAVDNEPVSANVQVQGIYDTFNGHTACKNALTPLCGSQAYSDCTQGVEYSYLDGSTVVASWLGRQCLSAICYNYYSCGGTCVGVCKLPPPPKEPVPRDICPCSPLVIDLGHAGIRMTSAADGVSFDVNTDGWAENVSWTAAGEGDGFIVFDRDHNGRIDNGGELFGDATWQPESATPNGFAALGVYDTPDLGGNGDGTLSAEDAVWSNLRIWVDSSHDGVSQLAEIFTFEHFAITSIDLDAVESRARDRFGNEVRYRAKARLVGHPPLTDVVDVFLEKEPE